MIRFTSFAIVAPLVWGLSGSAYAQQSQAEIAARLNEEGKELMYADKYAEAARKFQEAVARVPEAKYFVNLCTARLQEGKLDEALTACNAVELNNPSPDQKSRAEKLTIRINEEAKKQNLELHAGGGGGGNPNVDPHRPPDPSTPPPGPTYTPAVGRPLETNLIASRPDNRYTWTLGFDIYGGGGRMGRTDYYGSALGGFRVKGDYLLSPANRIGGQLYLQYSQFGQGSNDTLMTSGLTVVDFGLAAYKDICLAGQSRVCLTPLVGAHLSTMSPEGSIDDAGDKLFNYAAAGLRAEIAAEFAFGRRFEHVLSIALGANLYSPVFSGDPSNDLTVADAGLDQGGAAAYFGIGYTYRFNTPLGNAPFIILE
jgi:hypothetical protein